MSWDGIRGWFADVDGDRSDLPKLWQPNTQIGGAILPLPIWFDTREQCEAFIRDELVGQGWVDGPYRFECPTCLAPPGEWCTGMATGMHADRKAFAFGGWLA